MLPLPAPPAIAAAATPAPAAQRTFTAQMGSEITQYARTLVLSHRTAGVSIGIVEDGRVVYERSFGYANLKHHTPYGSATQSYVGDISRAFAAAALLILQQDGKLQLDDKVTKFVPELTAANAVTVGMLLNQQSGLPALDKLPEKLRDLHASASRAELIDAIDKAGVTANATAADNPLNYQVAAWVVEKAAGFAYSDFLQQRIFAPLVMNATVLAGDNGASSLATGYTGVIPNFVPARPDAPLRLQGFADVITTVSDLEKWDIEFPILLRVDAVRTMFGASPGAGQSAQPGMGWWIDRRGGKRYVWQNGRIPGYRAMNALLPDEHIAVIVATNTDDARDGRVASPETIASRVLDSIDPPETKRLDNAVLERATEWLGRLQQRRIDRTQLTPAFSSYLTDELVAKENIASLGTVQAIVPVASWVGSDGDTVYEFVVRFAHSTYHYRFAVTPDGKINSLVLRP